MLKSHITRPVSQFNELRLVNLFLQSILYLEFGWKYWLQYDYILFNDRFIVFLSKGFLAFCFIYGHETANIVNVVF